MRKLVLQGNYARLVHGLLLAMSLLWAGSASRVQAGQSSSQVLFDVNYLVGCPIITPPDFAASNPDEQLLEARLQISSLIQYGTDEDLLQFLYQARSFEHSALVIDTSPKTIMETVVVGNLGIENKKETTKQFGLNVSGQYEGLLKGGASGDIGTKQTASLHYELLPPMELLAASGTIDRGYGAYFKLKPSPRMSLEGAKEFLLVLRVPRRWRADYLVVSCQAMRSRRDIVQVAEDLRPGGEGQFLVTLYLEGDEQAKAAAQRLVRAEMELRRVVAQHRERPQDRSLPVVVHKVGVLLDMVQPALSEPWLDTLVYQPVQQRPPEGLQELPAEVRGALAEFVAAKLHIKRLSGRDVTTVHQRRNRIHTDKDDTDD